MPFLNTFSKVLKTSHPKIQKDYNSMLFLNLFDQNICTFNVYPPFSIPNHHIQHINHLSDMPILEFFIGKLV